MENILYIEIIHPGCYCYECESSYLNMRHTKNRIYILRYENESLPKNCKTSFDEPDTILSNKVTSHYWRRPILKCLNLTANMKPF